MAGGSAQIFIGETQCGKTTLAKQYLSRFPNRAAVILSRKLNFGRPIFSEFKKWKKRALHDDKGRPTQSTIIILDEFDTYLRGGNSHQDLDVTAILTNAEEMNNLVVFIGHSFLFLPNWVVVQCNALQRWNTVDLSLEPFYKKYAARPALVHSLKTRPVLKKYESVFIPLR